jgi:SWI/SNF-related matrix-associated actin-dependent regulator 1 of chromatin subfamily A
MVSPHPYAIPGALPGGQLYNYQLEALERTARFGGRALIADEMGLGKTATALGWLFRHPEFRPALIVCPATIKLQWARETTRWLDIPGEEIEVMKGTKSAPLTKDIVICNYDILSRRLEDLHRHGFRIIILDESHYIKEERSKRSKMVKLLCDQPSVKSVLALTGTPVLSRPKELWHQVRCIQPQMFPNPYRFYMRYCDPHKVHTVWDQQKQKRNTAWDFSGASNLDELDRVLRDNVMIRRNKSEVLGELPSLETVTVPFEVNLSGYRKIRKEVHQKLVEKREELRRQRNQINQLDENARETAIAGRAEANSTQKLYGYLIQEITKLKKEAAVAKLGMATDWILDFVQSGEKLLIYTHHHDLTDALYKALSDKGLALPWPLDGRTPQPQRQKVIDQFGLGTYDVLICGLKAMGMGVDGLQHGASHLAFLEFGWTPGEHAQAAARLHRQGQEKPVTAYYLMAADTLDEKIATLLDCKSTVTSAVMGEMDQAGIMESIVDAIAEEA